jgi:hypothetical protein
VLHNAFILVISFSDSSDERTGRMTTIFTILFLFSPHEAQSTEREREREREREERETVGDRLNSKD